MNETRLRNWMAVGLVVLSATFTAAPPAHARCMMPQTFLAPAAGTTLPENPSLFLFVPNFYAEPVVSAWTVDGDRPLAMTEISKGPAHTSYRIDVRVEAGKALTVRVQDPKWETQFIESEFTMIESIPSSKAPITVRDIATEISHWTCSFQQTHNLRLSHAAPAFRVEWSTTKSDYASGKRETVVVPSHMMSFFDQGRSAPTVAPTVELGHTNCFGHTLQWTGTDPVYVGITALHADGTEQVVTKAPLSLYPPERSPLQRLTEDYIRPLMHTASSYIETATGWVP